MKLHLPKVLLTAVIAAAACVQQAYADPDAWKKDGGVYYEILADSTETINAYSAADGELYQVKAAEGKTATRNVTTLILRDGDVKNRFMQNWRGDTSLNALIGTLQFGNDAEAPGSGSFISDGGNVITIGQVSGTLKSMKNGGTLTIGTNAAEGVDASTTTIGGTLINMGPASEGAGIDTTGSAGTFTLNGNITISADASFTGFVLDTNRSGVGYSAVDGNGYKTITNAHYYLVQGGTTTVTSRTATLGSKEVELISDAGSVLFAAGDVEDRSWYYVNNTVNYGSEGGVNDAPGFALNGGTLNLNSSLDSGVVTKGIKAVAGTTSTLNLASGVVLDYKNAYTQESGATVNMKGTGTVLVKDVIGLTNAASHKGLSFGDGWNGVVELKDSTSTGFGFNNFGSKLRLNGVTGWFKQSFETLADIEIANGGWHITDSSNSTNKFNGKVSGTGDITYASPLAGRDYSYNLEFNGDTSEWSGNITINDYDTDTNTEGMQAKQDLTIVRLKFQGGSAFAENGNSTITSNRSNGTVEVWTGKSGTTTQMNAAVVNAGEGGSVNVIATHDTVFNKSLDVTSLEVRAGATATLKAETTTGSVTVRGDGALEFDGGTLNVASSLTLDASAIKIAESLTKDADAKTLITVSGEGSILTVNGIDSWTGSTYIIDGSRYTTSLNKNGSSLLLKFDAVTSLDLVVATAALADGVLTLNVTEDLSGINSVNLTLSDAALDVIAGQYGEVTLDLVGLNNTGKDVTSISFYNAYVGEANGTYRVEYIPEPATATLSLLALAGLAARRRRK